jgi:ribonuclease R
MHKRKGQKGDKLKKSLHFAIRKIFEKEPTIQLNHKQVCTVLDIRENALRKLAYNILEDLRKEGFLKAISHGNYILNAHVAILEGFIQISARGAGFLLSETNEPDVYISPEDTQQAMNGDKVKVQIIPGKKKRKEGKVIEVIERERTQFVGRIQMHDNFGFLVPDNSKLTTDIYIPKEKLNGAKDGDRALVKITVWPKSAKNPYGEVIETMNHYSANDSEMIGILCNNGIDYIFPNEVISEAEYVGLELDQEEVAKRRDFRSITTFTIDPHDAKDFDDALSFQKLENGNLEIGVHIADVSHYVRPGTAMDTEALKRSNSVYLVDRVIPMLPEQLSNMACSLRPNEDKFSFSAVFEIDLNGKIYNEWFGKTVIHSNKRYAYEDAQEVIEGKVEDEFKEEILTLDKIAKLYRKKRLAKGALSIESEEIRFHLDEAGIPDGVVIKTSKDAHKLIEEFMLLANRKVAEFIGKPIKGKDVIPFVYRCHDKPDLAKIAVFQTFIEKFGYELDVANPENIALNINALLDDIRYKNEYSLIQTMAIRSMSKANYETENIGHYGLAFEKYTHFTSPIRRYADLIVHRIVQEELTTGKHRYGSDLKDICKRISRMERKAIDAERESNKFFQTLYCSDKIGDTFVGTVSGLAEFGMFVRMDENYCEGLITMQDIPGDRYSFDPDKFRIIGSRTGKEYNFGDKVVVKIYEVHLGKRQIDLELVEEGL